VSEEVSAWVCSTLSRMPATLPWDDAVAEGFRVALQKLPDRVVRNAVARAIALYRRRPTVAELLSLAADCAAGHHPSPSAAWKEVRHLLETRGLYCRRDPVRPNVYYEGTPTFSHRLIGEVVAAMGGWRSLCLTEDGLEALRAAFLRLYLEHEKMERARQWDALCASAAIPIPDEPVRPWAEAELSSLD
jgi:hypothetical protein